MLNTSHTLKPKAHFMLMSPFSPARCINFRYLLPFIAILISLMSACPAQAQQATDLIVRKDNITL